MHLRPWETHRKRHTSNPEKQTRKKIQPRKTFTGQAKKGKEQNGEKVQQGNLEYAQKQNIQLGKTPHKVRRQERQKQN